MSNNLSKAKQERLILLESLLYWLGWANRKDLVNIFGISEERASDLIKTYKNNFAKDTLWYDYNEKKYKISEYFKPQLISLDISNFIFLVSDNPYLQKIFPWENLTSNLINNVPKDIFRNMCYAATLNKETKILYISLSSGKKERNITPHSFFYDGIKIYTRAYCHSSGCFKDFCLSRIIDVLEIYSSNRNISSSDTKWNNYQNITIIPAPKLSKTQKEAIERDYGMVDGQKTYNMREPLIFYFRKFFNLDQPFDDPLRQQIVEK